MCTGREPAHLASAEAQQVWVDLGGFTSVNQEVDLAGYPDAVSRALAEELTQALRFRFDLDDAIGGATQQGIKRLDHRRFDVDQTADLDDGADDVVDLHRFSGFQILQCRRFVG